MKKVYKVFFHNIFSCYERNYTLLTAKNIQKAIDKFYKLCGDSYLVRDVVIWDKSENCKDNELK